MKREDFSPIRLVIGYKLALGNKMQEIAVPYVHSHLEEF